MLFSIQAWVDDGHFESANDLLLSVEPGFAFLELGTMTFVGNLKLPNSILHACDHPMHRIDFEL